MNTTAHPADDSPLTRAAASIRRRVDVDDAILGERDVRVYLGELLPFGAAVECVDAAEARDAAESIGYPVVVKALSAEAVHKSDLGLVEVGCQDADHAERAAATLLERVEKLGIAESTTLSVQRQLGGVEIAIGIKRDPLGPLCMVSAGGTLIELIDDAAVRLAPVTPDEALEMLRGLRAWPLFDGYRGQPRVDVDALACLVSLVSELPAALPELQELDLNPVFVGESGCRIADARCVVRPVPDAPGPSSDTGASAALDALFHARRIAVVGASDSPKNVGRLIVRYLQKYAWPGEVVVVNPSGAELPGAQTYARLADVGAPVDLACIVVPAPAVEAVVDDCLAAGVSAGIIFTAGFAEAGEAGRLAQERLKARAGDRFRFVGPNSIGIAAFERALVATFGMALEDPDFGSAPVAFISQSGAIASSLISRAAEFGVGFSHWISTGNEGDLGMADFIDYFADDPDTKVICLFIEAIRDPQAFACACEHAHVAGKPIIVLKSGRSEAGQAATVSHTGALAGSQRAYLAFLEACGTIQVATLQEMLTAAQAIVSIGPVAGDRVAVVSMSGGACSLLADECADAGLTQNPLSEGLQAQLAEVLPPFASVRNPIDITAAAIGSPELVRATLEIIRGSGEADVILLQLGTNADPAAERMARDLLELRSQPGAPILVGRLGSPRLSPCAMRAYEDGGMHVFAWPEQLAKAARACVRHPASGSARTAAATRAVNGS